MTQHLQLPPGRRLDAMVAMCLGWRWYCFRQEILGDKDQRRFLSEPHLDEWRIELATAEMPLQRTPSGFSWNATASRFHWSTNDEAAFGAALKAGVFNSYDFGLVQGRHCLYHAGGVIPANTPAHVLCLGILAIQDEAKLDEYAAWLEGVE